MGDNSNMPHVDHSPQSVIEEAFLNRLSCVLARHEGLTCLPPPPLKKSKGEEDD